MKLNRRETAWFAVIVLSWATTPLLLHYFSPSLADRTGLAMTVGLAVAAVAAYALLMRIARRLDRECRVRLADLGFEVVGLPHVVPDSWIPAEHRPLGPIRFDGFATADDPRSKEGYRRKRDGVEAHLFVYSTRSRHAFVALRLERPGWAWPEFSCVVESPRYRTGAIEGWERIRFEADPEFSKACRVQAPVPGPVEALLGTEMRRSVLGSPWIRVSASGPALTLYSGAHRLIPGEAEAFLKEAKALAERWIRAAGNG